VADLVAFMTQVFQPDQFLHQVIADMGPGVYAVLFLIVFAETGLVITPFLPGDSLLFAAGAIAAAGDLGFATVGLTLFAAAVVGDAVNFLIGRSFGHAIVSRNSRLVKREHINAASEFFRRHGGKAIVLARFVPIVRTFAPFVAGMCEMSLPRFWVFNISGAAVWVLLFTGAGYLFGNLPWVEENLTLAMGLIVLASVVPIAIEAIRRRRAPQAEVAEDAPSGPLCATPRDK